MIINTEFERENQTLFFEPCTVTKTIELPKKEFDKFRINLHKEHDFIKENTDLMGYNEAIEARECLLVLCEGENDGILVDGQGYGYAYYNSYLPMARQLMAIEQSNIMNDFVNRMNKLVDKAVSDAIAYCEDGIYSLPVASLYDSTDGVVSDDLFEMMLSERPEIESLQRNEEFFIISVDTEICSLKNYKELSVEDVEIMVARHILWLNSAEGGEQADFRNCLVKDMDLSHKNLLSACMDNARFVNVKFHDAPMSFATICNTEFVNCEMVHTTAEECDIMNSKFIMCKLDEAYFTHSDFNGAEFKDSTMRNGSVMHCKLENADTDSLRLIDCKQGGSYDSIKLNNTTNTVIGDIKL